MTEREVKLSLTTQPPSMALSMKPGYVKAKVNAARLAPTYALAQEEERKSRSAMVVEPEAEPTP